MADTYSQIYIHLVFAVKYRDAAIDKSWRDQLYQYTIALVENRGHKVYAIGGMHDHIHIQTKAPPGQGPLMASEVAIKRMRLRGKSWWVRVTRWLLNECAYGATDTP